MKQALKQQGFESLGRKQTEWKAWMEREKNALKGTVTRLPAREDIDVPVEEHLIVELYSK